jgi:hypothetical protein
MKTLPILLSVTAIAMLAGCATSGQSVAEKTPGKFVTYTCEGNKSFQVRFDAENGTARIRTQEGSAELTRGDRGLYRDDTGEWILTLAGGSSTELLHKGKATYKQCTAQ